MNNRQCVVIGGEGSIGVSLIVRLLKLGNWIVRIADSNPHFTHQNSLISTALNETRASYHQLDFCNKSQVIKAVQGAHIVFYIGFSETCCGDYFKCYNHIVQGAKNVINACVQCNVERLIYNCTSDVFFDGSQALIYADESLHYPWKYPNMLNELRAQAESLVLSANKQNGLLLTCSLRPSNVFGPTHTYLLSAFINQANSSLQKFILGNGDNNCDFTYVENVAHSNICAAEAQSVLVGGKAFFITNTEPMYYWDFVSQIYKGLGYQRPILKFPAWIFGYILTLLKWLDDQEKSEYNTKLALAQFYIQSALLTRTFNCTAAEKHLGYSPIVSLDEGLTLTLKSFPHSTKDMYQSKYNHLTQESKAENLLNNGKVADVLLWRNEKETFIWFLAIALLFYWFFLGEASFVTSVARLLLHVSGLLFAQNYLPLTILGFRIEKASFSSYVQISNSRLRATMLMMASFWNKWINVIRVIAQGKNWNIFFKAFFRLYLLKLIFSISPCTLLGLAMILPFTSFFTYEQYEERIDGVVWFVSILMQNLKSFLFLSFEGCLIK